MPSKVDIKGVMKSSVFWPRIIEWKFGWQTWLVSTIQVFIFGRILPYRYQSLFNFKWHLSPCLQTWFVSQFSSWEWSGRRLCGNLCYFKRLWRSHQFPECLRRRKTRSPVYSKLYENSKWKFNIDVKCSPVIFSLEW